MDVNTREMPQSANKSFPFRMFSTKLFFILIFLILDFIHITFASVKKGNSILQDEDNIVRDVEPIGTQEQLASQTKEQITEQFKKLISKEEYNGIVKLGDNMNKNDFSEHLCSAMTTIGQYKNLFEYLTNCDMIPGFLVHSNLTLVKEAIIEFPTHSSKYYIYSKDINKAIIVCLDEDRPSRIFSLLEIVQARYVEKDRRLKMEGLDTNFDAFNFNLFVDYFRGKSHVPLKRFIALHGEELQRKHSEIFLTFFMALLHFLTSNFYDPDLRQLYDDLIGQSSPSMSNVPAEGFLCEADTLLQRPLVVRDWREAVAEGLRKKSPNTGQHLWKVIMAKYPDEFPAEFPPSDDTLTAVLEKFKTKQEFEDDWTKRNIPMLVEKLETIALNLPTVLWNIVFEYATITWTTTLSWETDNTFEIMEIEDDTTLEQDPQQKQVIIRKQEQFKELLNQGEYDEITKLGDDMESSEFLRGLCPLMATLDHLKGPFRYLENRKMLLTFLVHGNTRLVDEAIIEFNRLSSAFYIPREFIIKLITFFFNKCIYDRVIDILKATDARYMKIGIEMGRSEDAEFGGFMREWFISYSPEENAFPFKYFLTLHGQDFATKYPSMFDTFCERLVRYLGLKLPYPKAKTLLIDLVGQRSLLTSTTFARGFLAFNHDMFRLNFIHHGWKEAIEEGLKQECPGGGEQLWAVMVKYFPDKFSGAYPDTDELRAKACAGVKGGCASAAKKVVNFIDWGLSLFKKLGPPHPRHVIRIRTKKQIEDEWFEKNLPKLLKHFEGIAAFLPEEVMNVIYEYLTFTWIIS